MQGGNDFRTDHKDTEKILQLEKKIFQYKSFLYNKKCGC